MNELEQYIKSYFGVIQQENLKLIGSLFTLTTIVKGDFYLKKGRMCDKLGFIKSGI